MSDAWSRAFWCSGHQTKHTARDLMHEHQAASPVPLDAALLTRAMERAMAAVDDEWTIPEFADITAAEYAALATPSETRTVTE